jgi:hypothetical protein
MGLQISLDWDYTYIFKINPPNCPELAADRLIGQIHSQGKFTMLRRENQKNSTQK